MKKIQIGITLLIVACLAMGSAYCYLYYKQIAKVSELLRESDGEEYAGLFIERYNNHLGKWKLGELLVEPRTIGYIGEKVFPEDAVIELDRFFQITLSKTELDASKIEIVSAEQISDYFNLIYTQVSTLGNSFFEISFGKGKGWSILISDKIYLLVAGKYAPWGIFELKKVE